MTPQWVLVLYEEPRASFLHSVPLARAFHCWAARKFAALPEAIIHGEGLGLGNTACKPLCVDDPEIAEIEAPFARHHRHETVIDT
jgi:hypothetical protein